MILEMICTGEEVLSGQIVDTNAAWFANTMMEQGIEMHRRVTVGDRMEDLVSVFQERSHQADIILVNGGLGPTSDDLSAAAMAQAKNEPLVEFSEWRQRLERWYESIGRVMNQSNLKQAMLPESAVMIDNPIGTACGFRVKLNRAWLFFTPGVPSEFKEMVHNQFLPFIRHEFGVGEEVALNKLLTFGVGESRLADQLEQLAVPQGITIGYRSSLPHVEIKLFARGTTGINALPAFTEQVKAVLGESVVSERHPSLGAELHERLSASDSTLSLAESCTGGMLASQLITFPGSSKYLQQGLVTYSNAAKMKLLGVKETTLTQAGAVSEDCVQEMAEGVRSLLSSDYALATSGIAGPEGGSDDKPVGTVAFALATAEQTWTRTVHIPFNDRTVIRQIACAIALDMLRRHLLRLDPIADYGLLKRKQPAS